MVRSAEPPRFDIGDIEEARAELMSEAPRWPGPDTLDVAGLQLLLSALKSGVIPPAELLQAPQVARLCEELGLELPACAPASLEPTEVSRQ